VIGYVPVLPIEPVFVRAVGRHSIRALETERIVHAVGRHREVLEHDFTLAPFEKFEIYLTSISAVDITENDENYD